MLLPRGEEVIPERIMYSLKGYRGIMSMKTMEDIFQYVIQWHPDKPDITIFSNHPNSGTWIWFDGKYRKVEE